MAEAHWLHPVAVALFTSPSDAGLVWANIPPPRVIKLVTPNADVLTGLWCTAACALQEL